MAVNKVEANGETLIDLTNDTVTADTLVEGRTAHLASGEQVTGTFKPVTGVKGNVETTYRTGNVNLTPANIGLGNVNNTSDANKPISTAAQAALDKQQAQVNAALKQTGYNLLEITSNTQTINGVTFTVDKAAGTITANGTATALTIFYLEGESKYLIPGNYIISSGNNNNNYWFGIYLDSIAGAWHARVENEEFTIPNQYTFTQCALRIASGQTLNNVVFKPMIVPAELAGLPFQPYAKSNAELTSGKLDVTGNASTPHDQLPDSFELWTASGYSNANSDLYIRMASNASSDQSYLVLGNDKNVQCFGIEDDCFIVRTKDANSYYEFKDDGIYLNGTKIAP